MFSSRSLALPQFRASRFYRSSRVIMLKRQSIIVDESSSLDRFRRRTWHVSNRRPRLSNRKPRGATIPMVRALSSSPPKSRAAC